MIGGGCTLLKLAAKVDAIKETLPNEEQKARASLGIRAAGRGCFRARCSWDSAAARGCTRV